jgi:hypothetical protein
VALNTPEITSPASERKGNGIWMCNQYMKSLLFYSVDLRLCISSFSNFVGYVKQFRFRINTTMFLLQQVPFIGGKIG